MIQKIESRYDPHSIEGRVKEFWDSENIRKKSRTKDGADKFYFVDGPPYTTGQIHLGTTWNKILKDSILRYKTLKGYDLIDRPGWDMHGLPIEVKVEKKFGFESKKDIEDFGIDNFVDECKKFALKNKGDMTEQFTEFGAWFDWENPYMTIKNEYMESVWWALKKADERGLLEKGKSSVNWCPRCETAVADSEIEYEEIVDPSIFVKFRINQKEVNNEDYKGRDEVYFVIWTTTPWTLPSNLAIAVHPDCEYSEVRAFKDGGSSSERLIIASDLVGEVVKKGDYDDYEEIKSYMGSELEGMEYIYPLFKEVPSQKKIDSDKIHKVYSEDFVTVEKTGLVHIAPSHGSEDFEMGQKRSLPSFDILGPEGRFKKDGGRYHNRTVGESNDIIIKDLRDKNLLLNTEKIEHRYGHCWRCDTPIIYLATEQWFIRIKQVKEKMLEEIEEIEWFPEWAGSSRFFDWVSNAKDWCISRQRFWGTPLPIWTCDCGERRIIGSIDELKDRAIQEVEDLDLHRPHIDKIKIKCPCGSNMERISDVIDVWFDSAVASWANLNFPNQENLFEDWWPADMIIEGHDQTRGWFYSQLGASTVAFDRTPYNSVLMHGFVLDEDGKKMSKSKGNIVKPGEVIEEFGSDTLRLYLLSACAPWEDLRFQWEECENTNRMLNVFWNVYKFSTTYMALDNFRPEGIERYELEQEDKWILSKVNSMVEMVENHIEEKNIHKSARLIREFILEHLSRWYIKLIRDRTWVEAKDQSKFAAYETLYNVLMKVIITMSPYTPFISEEMYSNIAFTSKQSVHIETFPESNSELIDKDLEESMSFARDVFEAASHARQNAGLKLRWPVRKVVVSPESEKIKNSVEEMSKIISEQANTKKLKILEPDQEFENLRFKIKPKMDVIGPKFREDANIVVNQIENMASFSKKPSLPIAIDLKRNGEKKEIELDESMVRVVKQLPDNIYSSTFDGGKVFVDSEIGDEILMEGYANEIVRRIQEMRKELDLDVEDNIDIVLNSKDEEILKSIDAWKDYISHETRADKLETGEAKGDLVEEWVFEGKSIRIGIGKS